jgi:putative ABC transport system substrate-binding protein
MIMRRRQFLLALGSAATANTWPVATRAQSKVARIGFLGSATAATSAQSVGALREGLNALGYVEGKSIVMEFRWAEGKYEQLPKLVTELIHLNVDVLVTHGTPGTQAAKRATTGIPIVMAISGDAVATGIVTNLGRPEANVTGSTFFLPELNAKRLELLVEILPHVTHVGALSNPNNPVSKPILPAMQAAAAPLKLQVEAFQVNGPSEFDGAFAAIAKSHVKAVAVTEDGEFAASFKAIAALAIRNKLPSIGSKEYAEAGGLIGYGVNILNLYRRAAYFVDKILKGTKPAELPIEQPTRFEFVINLNTARTLGLNIPPMLLARADKVIE